MKFHDDNQNNTQYVRMLSGVHMNVIPCIVFCMYAQYGLSFSIHRCVWPWAFTETLYTPNQVTDLILYEIPDFQF